MTKAIGTQGAGPDPKASWVTALHPASLGKGRHLRLNRFLGGKLEADDETHVLSLPTHRYNTH